MAVVAILTLPICGQAMANYPRSEEQATDTARILVEQATLGNLGEAFQQASKLQQPGDTASLAALDQQRQRLSAGLVGLGAPGRVRLTDQSHFGGCITREFRARYSSGEVYWVLKFRQGTAGFYLYNLVATGPGI